MKKKLSRRETLRLMAITTAAFLTSCVDQTRNYSQPHQKRHHQYRHRHHRKLSHSLQISPQPRRQKAVKKQEHKSHEPGYSLYDQNISADGLMQIYETLGRKAKGKVAVKSTAVNRVDIISCNLILLRHF